MRCSCGAVLPEDARFCHKCGKPQFDEDIERLAALEPAPAPIPPPVAVAPSPSRISFKNSRAVVISLLVAAGTLIGLMAIAFLAAPLSPLVLCAAGFIAAMLYKGHSPEPLTTSAGARLGWMTGLWLFLIFAICMAIMAIYVSNPQGWQEVQSFWAQFPQFSKLQISQHEFLMGLLVDLPFFFFLLTLLPGLGGMLGAKLTVRRGHSS